MTDQEKKEETPPPEKKLFAESRGKYTLLDGQKVFQFEFSLTSSLEENLVAISFIREAVLKSITENDKKAKEKAKEEEKKPLEKKDDKVDVKK